MPVFTHSWPAPSGGPDQQQLSQRGPSLNVTVELPPLPASVAVERGRQLPPPASGIGLIDTGARFTAVEEQVLVNLGLTPVNVIQVLTPSGGEPQFIYPCQISFPGTPIPTIPFNAVGSKLAHFGVIALIGRDLLEHFLMVYNGREGFWTLAY